MASDASDARTRLSVRRWHRTVGMTRRQELGKVGVNFWVAGADTTTGGILLVDGRMVCGGGGGRAIARTGRVVRSARGAGATTGDGQCRFDRSGPRLRTAAHSHSCHWCRIIYAALAHTAMQMARSGSPAPCRAARASGRDAAVK